MTLSLPTWATPFETRDLDEIRRAFTPYGTHERTCLGRGELHVRWRLARLGNATVGWGESSLGQRIRAEVGPGVRLLHVTLGRPLTYRAGRRHFEATTGRAVLIAPGTEYVVSYGEQSRYLSVQIDESALRQALRNLGVDDRAIHAGMLEVPLGPNELAGLDQALLAVASANPGPGTDDAQAGHRLSSWMAKMLAPRLGTTSRGAAAASRLARLEEWIDAHLAEPLDMPKLCRVASLETRGLYKSFVKRRGMPPQRWVWSRRMAAARLQLMQAEPGSSVFGIAIDNGLTHAGRFSVDYRRRYGESPSATLSRSQGRT